MGNELGSPDELAKALAATEPSAGNWDRLDVERLSAEGRIDALVACEQLMRHVQALLVRVLGVMAREGKGETGLDEGCTEAEVVAALRLSSATVRQRLDQARTLTEWFPETVGLLASGQVSWQQVAALVDATAVLDEDVARRVQDRVLKLMPDQNPAATRKALRRAVLAADPEGASRRHEYQVTRRRVELRAEEDGMATLSLYTTAETGAALIAAVNRRAHERAPGDPRSLDQRRADSLAALALAGAGVRFSGTQDTDTSGAVSAGALVHVVVGIDTLLGSDDEPGELRGYGPIIAQRARALAFAPGSVWQRLLTAPDGTLLHADPHTYRPTAVAARFVRQRDQSCTFPGCAMPAARCDLDHVRPFDHDDPSSGGASTPENLHALCRRHHRLKTARRWNVTRDPMTYTAVWTAPTGHAYVTRPRPYLVAA
jgi:hypothetical protein